MFLGRFHRSNEFDGRLLRIGCRLIGRRFGRLDQYLRGGRRRLGLLLGGGLMFLTAFFSFVKVRLIVDIWVDGFPFVIYYLLYYMKRTRERERYVRFCYC